MLSSGHALQNARYRIERVVGRGGMGTVYLALQPALGDRRVAIKEMDVGIDDAEQRRSAVAQFRQEATLLARLEHPGLVGVTDSFEEDDRQYLVMSYIDGQTLEQRLATPPAVAEVLEWARQIAVVLEYLHGHQPPVIVRDLKPSNIMLDGQGRIRLIDFGIARLLIPGDQTSTWLRGVGTPGFAPVEQLSGAGCNPQSDIYAFGATLYRLLTRSSPPASGMLLSGEETLVPPSQVNPAVDASLDAVVIKMMALSRAQRYENIVDVRHDLQKCLEVPDGTVASVKKCDKCGTFLPPGVQTCARCRSSLPTTQPAQLPPQMLPPPEPAPAASPRSSLRDSTMDAVEGALVVALVGIAVLALLGAIFGGYKLQELLMMGILSLSGGAIGGILAELIGRALRSQMGDHRVVVACASALAGSLGAAIGAMPFGRSLWLVVGPAAGCLGGLLAGSLRISLSRLTASAMVGAFLGADIWENYPQSFYDNFFLGQQLYHISLSRSDWNILLTMAGAVLGAALGLMKPEKRETGRPAPP